MSTRYRTETTATALMDARIVTAADVTDEIIEQAVEITDGWYADGPIDWDDVWDRLERSRLADGRGIDLGNDQDTPAMRKIRREIRKRRREG